MILRNVTLDDKYAVESGRICLTGVQALVRLPMMQRRLDIARGLKTAVFISGYRGSPLASYDLELGRAKKFLDDLDITLSPGINEDLAATALWGTQQVGLMPGATREGVTGLWYGKGPGVDRAMDALRHANMAGTSRRGGVLALAGDDHTCRSSTFPHQSEQAFIHALIPVLNPAGIADAMDLGLHGIALSRYAGCWTALKIVGDLADGAATVDSDPFALSFKTPGDFDMPKGGLNIRARITPAEQEELAVRGRLPAARAYARANGLDRCVINPAKKRLVLVTTGKAFTDTMQALSDLGLSPARAADMGIAVYKVALVWPMEEEGIKALAAGAEEILVIEEKRPLMEDQVKRILYGLDASARPRVVGKADEKGAPLLPETGELTPPLIAAALVKRAPLFPLSPRFSGGERGHVPRASLPARLPHYCSGCPHGASTKVPEGSRAMAGIGCHYMALWMDRDTAQCTQMGGEGVPWIGQAPFTREDHVFVNLGDGTYFHSGLLAIRAAVAAKVNITYKILFNDAVAMTGGQKLDGALTVARLAEQLRAEGVETIVVASDAPEKHAPRDFPPGTRLLHRDELDVLQKRLRVTPGVSVLIYDQTCAVELRRRRRRDEAALPKRAFINERVCEGCGDCGEQSSCLSVIPVETEFGRKRQIEQSSCNADLSCVKGFCPSFVTVRGGALKKPGAARPDPFAEAFFQSMPEPAQGKTADILITGIGGTGVVTVGAILGMAAHLEGRACTTMDQTGLAQKNGAVMSHVRLAAAPEDILSPRLGPGSATLILGGDLLVTAQEGARAVARRGRTRVVLNTHVAPTAEFTRDPDWHVPADAILSKIHGLCAEGDVVALDAARLSAALLGDPLFANMFLLGVAWQKGLIPVSAEAISRALELNGAAVEENRRAFVWGRRAAFAREKVEEIAKGGTPVPERLTQDERVARRIESLTAYQDAAYAEKYRSLVEAAGAADRALLGRAGALSEAVARYYYKLMAVKDEYEVARLYTDGAFMDHLAQTFEDGYKIEFSFAFPVLSRLFGGERPKKIACGAWIWPVLCCLARMKVLRGTPFDMFGHTRERKTERRLIAEYRDTIDSLLPRLTLKNYGLATDIASVPEHIRGYGPVKAAHLEKAVAEREALLAQFEAVPETAASIPLAFSPAA